MQKQMLKIGLRKTLNHQNQWKSKALSDYCILHLITPSFSIIYTHAWYVQIYIYPVISWSTIFLYPFVVLIIIYTKLNPQYNRYRMDRCMHAWC